MATCSPSRTALLTSRHTATTHVWDLYSYFRNVTGNFTTLPQYFKEKGYYTAGMGKIFHPGDASGGTKSKYKCDVCKGSDDGPYSWVAPYFHHPDPIDNDNGHSWLAVPKNFTDKNPLTDMAIAQHAVETLRNVSKMTQPFFVAVGFHRPHLPFVFPERFLDLYPQDDIRIPPNDYAPWGMPEIAWQKYGETRSYHDIAALHASGDINTTLPDKVVKDLRRAYYSAVSYTDENIGKVLSELTTLGLDKDTIVVFWGDHGWQLGEHGEWDKHTNFDVATHAPALFRVPGLTDGGIRTTQFTETIDIFPSVVDFALGEQIPSCPKSNDASKTILCTEGMSVRPLIQEPNKPLKVAAFSTYPRGIPKGDIYVEEDELSSSPTMSNCLWGGPRDKGCAMGYTMITNEDGSEYRYTEWVDFPGPSSSFVPNWSTIYAKELYNHSADPGENHNIVKLVEGSMLLRTLHERLENGWRQTNPPEV